MIVVPGNAQVRKPANRYSDLTGSSHHPERDAVIGAQNGSADRGASLEEPCSFFKSQSLEVPTESGNVEDQRLRSAFEHRGFIGLATFACVLIDRRHVEVAWRRAGAQEIVDHQAHA